MKKHLGRQLNKGLKSLGRRGFVSIALATLAGGALTGLAIAAIPTGVPGKPSSGGVAGYARVTNIGGIAQLNANGSNNVQMTVGQMVNDSNFIAYCFIVTSTPRNAMLSSDQSTDQLGVHVAGDAEFAGLAANLTCPAGTNAIVGPYSKGDLGIVPVRVLFLN